MAGNRVVIEFIGETSKLSSAIGKANAELAGAGRSAGLWAAGLTAVAGGTAAIGASVGAIGSLGLAFGVVKMATGAATDALHDYNKGLKSGDMTKYQEDLARMPPIQRQFTKTLVDTKKQFQQVSKAAMDNFLPGATRAVKGVTGLFPVLSGAIGRTGKILSDTADQFANLFQSDRFKNNLDALFRSTEPVTRAIGGLFVKLTDKIVEFGSKMAPAVKGFADLLTDVQDGITGFLDELSQPGAAEDFKSVLDSLGSIVKDLLPVLGNLAVTITRDVAPALKKFADWFHDHRDTIKQWAPIILGVVLAIKGLNIVKDVAGWARGIAGAFKVIGDSAAGQRLRVKSFGKALGALALIGIGSQVAAAIAPGEAGQDMTKTEGPVLGTLDNTANDLGAAVKQLVTDPGQALSDMKKQLEDLAQTWRDGKAPIQEWNAQIGKSIGEAQDSLHRWGVDTWQSITKWVGDVGRTVGGFFAGLGRSAWDGLSSFARSVGEGLSNVLTWFRNLPGNIARALGNLGGLLWNAGVSILQGLIDGLRAMWSRVTSFVSGIAGWIAAHKGPVSYDRQLLVPHGKAVMGGFLSGLQTGNDLVQRFVAGVAPQTQAAMASGAGAGTAGSGGLSVHFTGSTDGAFAAAFMQLVRTGQIQIRGTR